MIDMSSKQTARPVLKWAGGKRELLPELTARMPAQYGRYFEPCVGGGALFFHLDPLVADLGDQNAELILTYKAIAQHPERVAKEWRKHEAKHSPKHYDLVRFSINARRRDHEWRATPAFAAAFLYINRAGFNGMWRVNASGDLNTPWGKRDHVTLDVANLYAASAQLRNVTLHAGHYSSTVRAAKVGDFVYFDPPYHETFTSYTADGWGDDQQRELADVAKALLDRGCHVMLSSSDTPLIRSLYQHRFAIDVVKCRRNINSDGAGRGAVDELIIYAGPRPARRATTSQGPQPMTDTNKQPNLALVSPPEFHYVQRHLKRQLPVAISEDEQLKSMRDAKRKKRKLADLEQQLEDETKKRKAELKDLEQQIDRLEREVADGAREMTVLVDIVFHDGMVYERRQDTGEESEGRAATPQEATRFLPQIENMMTTPAAKGAPLLDQARAAQGKPAAAAAEDQDDGTGGESDEDEDDGTDEPPAKPKRRGGRAKKGGK